MTDTSETYIKMCEKGHKVIYPHGENVLLSDQSTLYWDVDSKRIWLGLEMIQKYKLYGSMATTDFREYFPIYRQDQLQEMLLVDEDRWNLVVLINNFCHWYDYTLTFGSMEQLWMAFIMKKKFNKVWDGENWIEGRA